LVEFPELGCPPIRQQTSVINIIRALQAEFGSSRWPPAATVVEQLLGGAADAGD